MKNPLAIPPRTLSALLRRLQRALPDVTWHPGTFVHYPGHPTRAPWAVSHHDGAPRGFRIGWYIVGYDKGDARWAVAGDSTVEAAAKASGFALVLLRGNTVYLRPLP